MKGIAHFMTGVALATCFADVVGLARNGSLLPVLGGVGGLLPDLLDFRFVRYFDHFDAEIDPCPREDGATADGSIAARVAAESVAESLAGVMREAFETGRPRRVVVHTVQLGPDLWRRYTVSFGASGDAGNATELAIVARKPAAPRTGGGVRVEMGPLVSTSGVSLPGSDQADGVPDRLPSADRLLDFELIAPYGHDYVIDSFTGPTFTFTRDGDALVVTFLDWHHRWTHSLLLAAAIGLAAWALGAIIAGPTIGLLSGILIWAGITAHCLEDQLGYMGCNLFWPVTRRRMPGLGLLHAGEAIPNFLVVWSALALILHNLDRFGGPGLLTSGPYLALVIGVPWSILGGVHLLRRRAALDPGQHTGISAQGAERLAETQSATDV